MLQMIHGQGGEHHDWRGLLTAAALAISLHLGLIWAASGGISQPHTQAAQKISMTLLTMAASAPAQKPAEPTPEPAPEPEPAPAPEPEPSAAPAPEPLPDQTPEPALESTPDPVPQPEPQETSRSAIAPAAAEAAQSDMAGSIAAAGQSTPDSEPDHSAAFLNNPPPHYPNAARRRGYEGMVILDVEVLASGHCGQIKILESSGHDILDREALNTVKNWRFVPAKMGGIAIDRWYQVPVRFHLSNR